MPKTIQVSDETWAKIKDVVSENEENWEIDELGQFIGKKLFIRTVTYHLTGEVDKMVGKLFHLKKAAWIADSGRFADALKNGEVDEVEPVGECWVNIDTIVDIFPWKHNLPQEQK